MNVIDSFPTLDYEYGPYYKGSEAEQAKESYRQFSFDEYASHSVPFGRDIADIRSNECKLKTYDASQLPATTVIITFVEESWSTLMRTIHSVIKQTPPNLLAGIVLVDDSSKAPWLGEPLEAEIKKSFPSFVKLIRTPKRVGVVHCKFC